MEEDGAVAVAVADEREEDGAAADKLEEDVAVEDEREEDGAAADYLEEDMAVAMAIRMRTGPQRQDGQR